MTASLPPDSYLWIVILSGIIGFVAAFGIGANDVANAFATSVGAKALTLKQAVMCAAIFEFSGAVLMGARVTDTVRKGIVSPKTFASDPSILMLGMLCALISVSIWLLLATKYSLPVSTTHSIIGAIIGFSMVYGGASAVNWSKVGDVVLSWFLSPVLSGVLAALLFFVVLKTVLRRDDSYKAAWQFYPALIGFTIAVNVFYFLFKGAPALGAKKSLGVGYIALISIGSGIVLAAILAFTLVPFLKKRVDEAATAKEDEAAASVEMGGTTGGDEADESASDEKSGLFNKDIHGSLKDKESKVSKMHDQAEKFDDKTEDVFSYLQIFTACFDSFAHGANDVANAMGPLAAIYGLYEAGASWTPESKGAVPIWILALGGAGIVAGLALYGYNIISAIGVKLVKITPARGFTIELGSALVIITGSALGLPLSTTHCQVGATVGLGLFEGKGGVNWWLLLQVFGGWVITLVVAGLLSAGIFAFAAYSPVANVSC